MLLLDLHKAAHKLHYRTEFQGLPISVENKKGSYRYWKDPNNDDEEGKTKMRYAYGYVRGTLGMDGDEVDVYIGNNKKSEKVFIVTQNKQPDFKEIDEQKVMLGFDSAKDAKAAYIKQYDNPKFFHSIKEMGIEEFRNKLSSQKGKLIKDIKAAKMSADVSDLVDEKVKTVKKSTEGTDILKALNARFASLIAKKHRMIQEVQEFKNRVSTNPLKHELVEKTAFSHAHEAPPVRAERVSAPVARHATAAPIDSCGTCGYSMAKSQDACPICTVAANIQEAKPRGV